MHSPELAKNALAGVCYVHACMRTYDDSDILLRNSLRVPTYYQMFGVGGREEGRKERRFHSVYVRACMCEIRKQLKRSFDIPSGEDDQRDKTHVVCLCLCV